MTRNTAVVMVSACWLIMACNRERIATSPRSPMFQRVSLSAFQREPDASLEAGACRQLSMPEYPSSFRTMAYIIPAAGQVTRRILVVVDSLGVLRRYSDIRSAGPERTDVEVNFQENTGMVVRDRTMARASSAEVFDSETLGRPHRTADLVRQ